MRLNGRLTAMKISEGNVLQPKGNYCKYKKIKGIAYLFNSIQIFLKKNEKNVDWNKNICTFAAAFERKVSELTC
jgi:hypothetical protein